MRRWKAAGPAPKGVDDQLWQRFRGAQDTFFGNRDKANAELDAEFIANAEKKEALLVEAEALVPVTDLRAAKEAFRDIADRWDAAGKVPRDRMKELEGRIRKVEQEIRGVEEEQWRRTDPEKSARADDMVSKLEAALAGIQAELDAARSAGDEKKVRELEENLASRQAFLEMARRASADYSG
jgi:capsule polysaccharide export protein KpsE/RkpR